MDQENENVMTGKIIGSNLGPEEGTPSSSPYLSPETNKGQIGPRNKRNSAVISLLIGLGLVFVLATIALASGMWDPLWNPFQPAPDKVVSQAFLNTSALKTAHVTATVNGVASGDLPENNGSVGYVLEGDIDQSNKDNPKSQMTFDVNASVQGVNLLFGGEFRSLNKAFYFKLNTIPAPITLYLSAMGINLDSWKGKWISFDAKDLGMSIGASAKQKQGFSKDVQKLLLEKPIAKTKKRLVDEKINGQNNYHYLMALDKENFKQFLVQIPDLITKYNILPGGANNISEKEKQEALKSIDEAFDKTGGFDFEIWISKKYRVINKIAFNKTFKASDFGEKGAGKLALSLELLYSKFNQPVKIEAPAESTSIMQLLAPLMQMFMKGSGSDSPYNTDSVLPNYDYYGEPTSLPNPIPIK